MATVRYGALLDRRNVLRKALVPPSQSISGRYAKATVERAAAYPVMIHAEIEAYIEDVLSGIAEAALDAWTTRKRITRPLLAMVAHREGDSPVGFSEDIFAINAARRLETVVQNCYGQWRARLGKNHGIRATNLAKIFMSVGFIPPSSDQTILNSLDGFAAQRGLLAHTSPVSRSE